MPVSRRYEPEFAPGETSSIGMDYSFVIPPGVGIVSGELFIQTNTQPPLQADLDFAVTDIEVTGRAISATVSGGVAGKDYQFKWSVTDTEGNTWPRTALLLCADTS